MLVKTIHLKKLIYSKTRGQIWFTPPELISVSLSHGKIEVLSLVLLFLLSVT